MSDLVIELPKYILDFGCQAAYSSKFNFSSLPLKTDKYLLDKPAIYDVVFSNTGDGVLLSGNISAIFKTQCARCLEQAYVPIDTKIYEYFVIDNNKSSGDNYLNFPADRKIDLGHLIIQTFMQNVPTQPLCKLDCLGLCAQCGQNLNINKCNCNDDNDDDIDLNDNPFSVLKDFKVEG